MPAMLNYTVHMRLFVLKSWSTDTFIIRTYADFKV